MLTAEQNDTLTRVRPGTPMGDLMRRYWHPVAASSELAPAALRPVQLLGEDLVLFRDPRGRLGLLAAACGHRGTALAAGTVEERGLRCAAHSWLYHRDGRCLEQPLEPRERQDRVGAGIPAYPVEELGGLIFAYLGPPPAPLLPRYNVLVWDDAIRETNGSRIPCNWLQVMENLLDPVHVESLHGRYFAEVLARQDGAAAQDFLAHHCPPPMKQIGFARFADGMIERHVTGTEQDASWRIGTPAFFPTTSLVGATGPPTGPAAGTRGSLIFVVPLDDTHTWFLLHMAERTGHPTQQRSVPFVDVPGVDQQGAFLTATANGQDHMAVVTQGDIAARSSEHLCASDAGIVLYRELLVEQLERVQQRQDPINVRRDPAANQVINAPVPSAAPDMTGWSRQRRRWAARHP
jgi:5,5'-dehydrodivanillate O-demethylase